jgi:hypothetical protein
MGSRKSPTYGEPAVKHSFADLHGGLPGSGQALNAGGVKGILLEQASKIPVGRDDAEI